MIDRPPVPTRPGLVGRALSAQAAQPRGLLGRALGRLWVTESAAINDRAIALLGVTEGDRVLEIGFGPGRAVHELAARGAAVTGVDPAPAMLAAARRRNAAAVRAGQVHLLVGHADALPAPDAAFDAVLAVHCLYFWRDLDAGLREIRRVLTDGGRVVLTFLAAEHGLPHRFDPVVYRVPTTARTRRAMEAAGFVGIVVDPGPHGVVHVTAHAHPASFPDPHAGTGEVADSVLR